MTSSPLPDQPTRLITTFQVSDAASPALVGDGDAPEIDPTIRMPTIGHHQMYMPIPSFEPQPANAGLSPSGDHWLVPVEQKLIAHPDGTPDYLKPDWQKFAEQDGYEAGKIAAQNRGVISPLDIPQRSEVLKHGIDMAIDRFRQRSIPPDAGFTQEEITEYFRLCRADEQAYMRDFSNGYMRGFEQNIQIQQYRQNDPGHPGSSWG